MTRAVYLSAFLSLVQEEGPYNIIDFTQKDDDIFWLTLQLPEPYKKFEAKNVLFALDFESVDFQKRIIRFVIAYPDLVSVVERAKARLKEKEITNVTSVDESRAMIAAGRDIFTARWYWEKSCFPADCPWYLHPVPMADRQLQMDEYDRFFTVNHADVARGRIVPAWLKQNG